MESKKYVIAVGNFDGVHLGHRLVLDTTKKTAEKLGLLSAALTFTPNPHNLFNKENPVKILTDDVEKEKLIKQCGIYKVIFQQFDFQFAALSCVQFVDFLQNNLSCHTVVCGENFKFGKNAMYDVNDLSAECKKHGMDAISVPIIEGICSTNIRNLLINRKPENAASMLGRYFSIESTVVSGNHLGKKIGFPTINQKFREGMIVPGFGVYGSYVFFDGKKYLSVTDIGTKPTVNNDYDNVCAETNIIGFSGDLYGKKIKVYFTFFIRDEIKFTNCDDLKMQIKQDCNFVSEKGFSELKYMQVEQ